MKSVENNNNCKHSEIISDRTYQVCSECGLIFEDDKLVSNLQRVYNGDADDKIHYEVFDHFGRGTMIRVGKHEVNANIKSTFQRISKTDKWYDYTTERKAQSVKILVISFLTNNGINKSILKSINYYILKTKMINLQGKSLECYTAALLIYVFILEI